MERSRKDGTRLLEDTGNERRARAFSALPKSLYRTVGVINATVALECLKSWRWGGLVAAGRESIQGIADVLNVLCEEDLA